METTSAIFSSREPPDFAGEMEFNTEGQLEDIEQGTLCMDAMSSGVTMATVTISPHDIQAMTENGSAAVRYEAENSQNQVMSLFLQPDTATDLQHITSLAEQQGISIMQEPVQQMEGDTIKGEEGSISIVKQDGMHDAGELREDDDTASLLAKLEANNPNRNSVVQLTSDGKIIKGLTMQRVAGVECANENSGSYAKAGRPLQQITLPDGITAYVQHIGQAETMQMVRLTDGTVAYMAADMLQPVTATVNLNLQAADQSQGKEETQKRDSTSAASTWINELNTGEEDCDESGSEGVASAQPHVGVAGENERTVQVSVSGGQRKTIRVQLAEEGAHSLGIDEKIYKCLFEDCGKIYTSHHHLKVHQRSHTGDRPYICDDITCQKAFATAYGLKSHKRIHTGEKPYRCTADGCRKAFKTSGDLQKHTRTHTGEKPFVCPFEGCNKRFTTSNIRKVHIRVHTGERPYQCPVTECSKKFSSATNYKNHIRIHTGERPYVCTVPGCGKRFTEYSSLYKHHVVHTHSKPYVCSHCGKTYRQTSTLAMHKRQAHNDDSPLTDLEIALVLQPEHPPPDPKVNYMPESEIGEGALVINTSEAQTSQNTETSSGLDSEYTESVPHEPRVPMEASTLSTVSASTAESQDSKPNISIVVPAGHAGTDVSSQRLFIITDPSQTQAVLQQIAGQRVDLREVGVENITTPQTARQPAATTSLHCKSEPFQ